MTHRLAAVLFLTLAIGGCGSATEPRGGNERVTAIFDHGFTGPIVDRSGKRIGTVTGKPGEKGLIVAFEVSDLKPGRHGVHLHSTGRCDPPDFASSGPHWGMEGQRHGMVPQGPHDGDWDNLEVAADGHGSTDRMIPRWHHKVPETGLSLVIHAGEDDEATQPSGNSGERIACTVVIPPA
ncbi:MAG TPA: superoxide dismutase family protein [Sphingomicrobium sp.]